METSNNIFNQSLYSAVSTSSLLSWQRTAIANRVATNGATWYQYFAYYNSGTYNNQWMIVDFKQARMGAGLLWVVEQIPGYVEGSDLTPWVLANSYWASYNIPYFKDIYSVSGYAAMFQKYGNEFSWESCPRANIFRRNESAVETVEDVKALMRYNNYLVDPIEDRNPFWAIASRGDLATSNPSPFGGLDSKVTSSKLRGNSIAQCGPTHVDLPPFSWASSFNNWPHYGQPQTWNFDWMPMDILI